MQIALIKCLHNSAAHVQRGCSADLGKARSSKRSKRHIFCAWIGVIFSTWIYVGTNFCTKMLKVSDFSAQCVYKVYKI